MTKAIAMMMVVAGMGSDTALASMSPRAPVVSLCQRSLESCMRGAKARKPSERTARIHGQRLARFLASAAREAETKQCKQHHQSCARLAQAR